MGDKLEQWRGKTEREKHTLALVGAVVFTFLVVLFWGYTFFITMNDNQNTDKTAEYNKEFSPLAPIRNLFGDNIDKIKAGFSTAKNSAAVILEADKTTPTPNQ